MKPDINRYIQLYSQYEEHTREFYDVSNRIISLFSEDEFDCVLDFIYKRIPELKNEQQIQGVCHLIGLIKSQQREIIKEHILD